MSYKLLVRKHGLLTFGWRFALRQFYKRVLRRDYPLRLPTGLVIWCPPANNFASEVILTGADVDWGAEAILAKFVEPTGVFVDVGAHIGYYALYFRPLVAEVHAFEPDARNLPWLRRNVEAVAGIHIHPVAVAEKVGVVQFEQGHHSELSRIASGQSDRTASATLQRDVPCTSLDEFPELQLRHVTAIKIDVEGADQLVLDGASRLVTRCQPLIVTECEVNPRLAAWCVAQRYGLFGFVRDRASGDVRFEALEPGSGKWTKMVFLVPDRLRERFVGIAART